MPGTKDPSAAWCRYAAVSREEGTHVDALAVQDLTKSYRRRSGSRHTVVSGSTFTVKEGEVHALLGPNGCGKTTTLRMVMGLVRPQRGNVVLFGRDLRRSPIRALSRVAAIVEQPRFLPSFSGRENMQLIGTAIDASDARIKTVLEGAGLGSAVDEPFSTYSLGMKQRFAIAAVSLKEADLVIFDEPTNGLDPEGIMEVRSAILALRDQGRTILLSSHLLSEVQSVATAVTIMKTGQVVASGGLSEILTQSSTQSVLLRVADPSAAMHLLERGGLEVRSGGRDNRIIVSGSGQEIIARLIRDLAMEGIDVYEVVNQQATLEDVFLSLTESDGEK